MIVISVWFRKFKLACALNRFLGTYSQYLLCLVLIPKKQGIIKPLNLADMWTNTWKIMRLLNYGYNGFQTNNWDGHPATLPCHCMQTMTAVPAWGLRELWCPIRWALCCLSFIGMRSWTPVSGLTHWTCSPSPVPPSPGAQPGHCFTFKTKWSQRNGKVGTWQVQHGSVWLWEEWEETL